MHSSVPSSGQFLPHPNPDRPFLALLAQSIQLSFSQGIQRRIVNLTRTDHELDPVSSSALLVLPCPIGDRVDESLFLTPYSKHVLTLDVFPPLGGS